MSVFNDVKFAIENRWVIRFNYGGCPRVVEPYLLGETTKGTVALRGYQTERRDKQKRESPRMAPVSVVDDCRHNG